MPSLPGLHNRPLKCSSWPLLVACRILNFFAIGLNYQYLHRLVAVSDTCMQTVDARVKVTFHDVAFFVPATAQAIGCYSIVVIQ